MPNHLHCNLDNQLQTQPLYVNMLVIYHGVITSDQPESLGQAERHFCFLFNMALHDMALI